MRGQKEPLYRKVNTRARGVHHGTGGEYRWTRSAAPDRRERAREGSMRGTERRGLDYTPLFRFLLSRVGEPWEPTYREAVARLDRPEPIFWLVARSEEERRAAVRIGESSHYSGLYVDDDGLLAKVDPAVGPETLVPSCSCCTHTFNGVPFTRRYGEADGVA